MKKLLFALLLLLFTACAGASNEVDTFDAVNDAENYEIAYSYDDYEGDEPRVLFEVRTEADAEAEVEPHEYYEHEEQDAATTEETTSQTQAVTEAAVTTTAQATAPTTTEAATQAAYNYILNINSLLFHRMDCDTLPLPQNRRYFVYRADAVEAAYRGCNRCNP